MADLAKYAQLQYFTLAGSGPSLGDVDLILSKFNDIDGNPIIDMTPFGDKGFGTIEPGAKEQEEQISFTGVTVNIDGTTTLTGVSNVTFLAPYTETSGLLKSHAGGVKFIISNTSGYYNRFANKLDEETIEERWTFNSQTDGANPVIDDANYVQVLPNELVHKQYVDSIVAGGGTTPPVVVDVNSGTSGAVQVNSLTYDLTFSGVDRGCLIQVATEEAQTITGITVGGVAAALVVADTDAPNNIRHESWFLASPALGLQSIVISLSGTAYIASGAEALTGVDQSTPTGTFGSDTGSDTTPTVTIATTYNNSLVFDGFATTGTLPVTATPGVAQITNWQELTGTYQGASSVEPAGMATDNITNDYLLNQSTDWVITSVEIKGITTANPGSNLTVEQEAVVIESPVDTINFTGNVLVTNPSAGQVDVSILGGSGGGGGTKLAVDTTEVTVANTVTETDLFAPITIAGGTIGTDNAIRLSTFFTAFGMANTGGQTLTIRVKYGGVTIGGLSLNPPDTAVSALSGYLYCNIVGNGATNSQKVQCQLSLTGDFGEADGQVVVGISKMQGANLNVSSFDSTVTDDLTITVEWSAASASNTLTYESIVVESISTSSNADKKKVGVGETDDITYLNMQYQFGFGASDSMWDTVGVNPENPMKINFSTADYFRANSAAGFTSLLPQSVNFSGTKQRIFQIVIDTAATSAGINLAGVGFEEFNAAVGASIIRAQGTNAVSIGFVRKDSDGTWYTRCADGAAFTEHLVTISDSATHVLRCEYDPANIQVKFYVDGLLVDTITTDIPAGGTAIGFGCGNGNVADLGISNANAPSFAVEI